MEMRMQEHVGVREVKQMSQINTKIISGAVKNYLRSVDLALVFGKTTETVDRSLNDQENILAVSSVAFKIDRRNITEAIKLPLGVSAMWKVGSTKNVGTYKSNVVGSVDENNWCLFYGSGQYGSTLFLILATDKANREDRETDPLVIVDNLIDVSGKIAKTSSGNILYCAVQSTPADWVTNYRTHYIPYFDVNDSVKKKEEYHTNNNSNATAICGAGNEQRCGTCCLYHSEGGYDSVVGSTFAAGGLYKCVESKCYQCIEIAQALGMRYVFNKWGGSTGATGGTGERCLSCDSTNFPSDCGPCPCTVDWTDESYYTDILNDKNTSSEMSEWKNANYEKKSRETYGNGSIARVSINLGGVPLQDKMVSSSWKDTAKYVPFVADVSTVSSEPVVQILTVKDMNGNEYLEGIAHPSHHGNGVGGIRIDETTWNEMFPNVPVSTLTIERIPDGGFTSNLNSMFTTGSLLSMTITKDDIENTGTNQTNFNMVSIQKIQDKNSSNALSGLAPSQPYSFNMSVVIEAHRKIGFITNTPGKGSYLHSQTNPYATGSHQTTKKEIQILSSKLKEGSSTIVVMEVATSDPDSISVGDNFDNDGVTWVVDSITAPSSYAGDVIDKRKSDILHLDKTNIDISNIGNDPNHPHSFRYDMFFGSSS
jgi:hypothetical protein